MKMKKLILLTTFGLFVAGNAFAQGKTAAAPPDPKIAACRTSLDGEYKGVLNEYNQGVKDKKIDATEGATFKKSLDDLKAKWTEAQKDGVSLKECEDQRVGMKKLQSDLKPMLAAAPAKGPDPKVQACSAANAKAHAANMQVMAKGRANGMVSKAEEAEFKKVEATDAKHLADLKKDGYTLAECETRGKDIAAEAALVAKITSSSEGVGACSKANATAHAANMAIMAKGRAAKKVTAAEEAEFKKVEAANTKHLTQLKSGGYTLAECETRAKDIAAEKALVEQIVK